MYSRIKFIGKNRHEIPLVITRYIYVLSYRFTDIKFVDEHDVVDDVIDDAMGVVELPGNPGDELDVGYLLQVLQQDLTTSLSGT